MLKRMAKSIIRFSMTSVSNGDKKEFQLSISRINVARARITSMTLIILEVMTLLTHISVHREHLLSTPYIYYGSMYVLMLAAMTAFYMIFTRLGADVPRHATRIRVTGVTFIAFILLWCAGISLLDQFSSGQVIVYVMAVISIAITTLFEPVRLILIYSTVHLLFLIAMPFFQRSVQLALGNSLNSTTFVVMSWAISCMRYKKQVEDFNNKKTILRINDELRIMNTQLQEANRRLKIMSATDGLTGVMNRVSFDSLIKAEWNRCKRHSFPLSLIMVDIDFFKEYNDNYGHQAGDRCVKTVATILSKYAKRSSDKVARYGGDEFVVLLPHMDHDSAIHLAEQIRKGVEERCLPHLHSPVADHITISLGVNTVIPSDDTTIDEFISNADQALYRAKKRRNCSVFAMEEVLCQAALVSHP